NENAKILGARCPAVIETRWLIYAIVIDWILEPLRGLISFFESDNALASDVFIMAYQVLLQYNNLLRNFPEFKNNNWAELIQNLAYSVTPCGSLSLSLGDLLLGPDLPECPEKKQLPQLYYFIKPAEDNILQQISITDRILGFQNNNEIDEIIDEEENDEEQMQKQDKSGEFQPYRDMEYDVPKDNGNIRMKTRSLADELIKEQLQSQTDIEQNDSEINNQQPQFILKALIQLNEVDWYETCLNEARQHARLIYCKSNNIKIKSSSKGENSKLENNEQVANEIVSKMVNFWSRNRSKVVHQEFLQQGAWEYWESRELTSGDAAIVDFCLRILSTAASEAPCERMISKARLLIGSRRWNTSIETLQGIIVVAESN
ncbi:MAG: hypothetical protein EZS28_036214, partial [Streblomastix strix]